MPVKAHSGIPVKFQTIAAEAPLFSSGCRAGKQVLAINFQPECGLGLVIYVGDVATRPNETFIYKVERTIATCIVLLLRFVLSEEFVVHRYVNWTFVVEIRVTRYACSMSV